MGNHLQVLAGRFTTTQSGLTAVEPLEKQGSASLLAIASADGLILLPEDRHLFAPGGLVDFFPW
ncbi:hypothetical protein [Mesorhizobium sp. CO1-1-8]|uniref:hypothetical protein n=1 Tax=Mesorhizobium sp. CO1-1-8 TaxID=2876631 RepID=UPI00398E3589